MNEKWYEVLALLFNNPFGSKITDKSEKREIAVKWFTEIRLMIYGWEFDASKGAMKDSKAKDINQYLVKVIRWAAKQEKLPRAHGSNSFTVSIADVAKWVMIYKKDHPEASSYQTARSGSSYVEAAKNGITWLLEHKQRDMAAMCALNPDYCCGCSYYFGDYWKFTALPASRSPNGRERGMIKKFCDEIGFDYMEVICDVDQKEARAKINSLVYRWGALK